MRLLSCGLLSLLIALGAFGAETTDTGAPATATTTAATAPADGTPKELDLDKTTTFRPLFDERATLTRQIAVLDADIRDLESQIAKRPPVDFLQERKKRAEKDLKAAEKKNLPLDDPSVANLRDALESADEDLTALNNAGPTLKAKQNERAVKMRRLQDVEQRIVSLFDTTKDINRYRAIVTYTLGALVFIVIVGFYVVALWSGIARTIFSGEMGMQFVTLFLIVIAIILFGIMGTLEGRELAALLGGLSGYILGRTSQPKKESPQEL